MNLLAVFASTLNSDIGSCLAHGAVSRLEKCEVSVCRTTTETLGDTHKWQEGYNTLKVQFSKMSASSGSSGYQADLVGSLDASNPKEEVERLIAKTKVVPAVNQLEFHPWVTQLRLAVQKLMRLTYPAQ